MFRSLIKTSSRKIRRNGLFSFLNVVGLSIGIAAAGLIFLWVEDELTFNHCFTKRNYLYQVAENQTYAKGISTFFETPGSLAAALKAEIPGIRNVARCADAREHFSYEDKDIFERGVYADSSLFSMLTMRWEEGNAALLFPDVNSVVISKTMALAIFGSEDPMGKVLRIGYDRNLRVSAVFDDLPDNSSFHFQWLAPFEIVESKLAWLKTWEANAIDTYVELEPAADPVKVNGKVKNVLASKVKGINTECFLFSMNDWNLYHHFTNGRRNGGRIQYVRLFSLIAWIIILIACINFMNLATSSSEQRVKEVGVRKVLGAGRAELVLQFIGESLIMACLSTLVATGIVYLVLPSFNILVEKKLSIDVIRPLHIGALLLVALITGILSGSYPAFYLSSFNPIAVLKGVKLKLPGGAGFIRKTLVVMQFSASVVLIISTVMVYQQVQYVKNREMGYSRDRLIYLEGAPGDHFDVLRNDLLRTGMVENAALSHSEPLHIWNSADNYKWEGKDPTKNILIAEEDVSPQYLSTMHMKLIAGRDFNNDVVSDSNSAIINDAMGRTMGAEGRIGALIRNKGRTFQVKGIVKDFVFNNMYGSTTPLMLFSNPANAKILSIRFRQDIPIQEALSKTEEILKTRYPGYAFEYSFVDKDFDQLFRTETLIGRLGGIFAMLAIFLSGLGLLGLTAFMVERRIKEIAVRKVLGATVAGLMYILCRDFMKLIIISCFIAFPIAWLAIHNWLKDYQYRVEIHWWIFLLTGILISLISLLTISIQTIRASLTNPGKALRSE